MPTVSASLWALLSNVKIRNAAIKICKFEYMKAKHQPFKYCKTEVSKRAKILDKVSKRAEILDKKEYPENRRISRQ